MAITLTASQRALVDGYAAEPTVVVDLDTEHGTYHFASEPFSWAGTYYEARLQNAGEIIAAIGGADNALPNVKTITVELANGDSWASARRPSFFRGKRLTVKEILRDVTSDTPLRTFAFTVVGGGMPSGGDTYALDAQEFWAEARRKLVPSTNVIITRDLIPSLYSGAAVGAGIAPMQMVYGRAMVPLYYVRDSGSGFVLLAGVGSLTLTGDVKVYEAPSTQLKTLASDSGYYAFMETVGSGVPATFVHVTTSINGIAAAVNDLYADVTAQHGPYPDSVLLDLLTNPWAGGAMSGSVVDSDSLLAARSFYMANSIGFDCVLLAQQPLETLLAAWGHEALTRVVLRDKMVLVPQQSRAPQGSFHPGNIMFRTLTMADAPLDQEDSRRVLEWRDRTRAIDAVQAYSWAAGSGAESTHRASFIGRASVAARVVQATAKHAAGGVRGYGWGTTIRGGAAHEEGDLVTLTHTTVAASGQLAEVTAVRRAGGVYAMTAREADYAAFNVTTPLPTDAMFARTYQRVRYSEPASLGFGSSTMITASHQLALTPDLVTTLWGDIGLLEGLIVHSFVSANNSQFTMRYVTIKEPGTDLGVPIRDCVVGWDIMVSSYY